MNENIIIREAGLEDIKEMAQLMTQLEYPTSEKEMRLRFQHISAHPDYYTLVAVDGEEIVGLAGLMKGLYYEFNGEYMRVLALVVKDTGRQRGIGKALIKACEQWAISQGLNASVISSGNRPSREAAHLFYQKVGYQLKSSGFYKQL